MRPLMIKGVIQRTEYDDIVTKFRLHEPRQSEPTSRSIFVRTSQRNMTS